MDAVTFTLTLPIAAPLPEYVKALRAARDLQIATGSTIAAMALEAVAILAEHGLNNINEQVSMPRPVEAQTPS